MRAAHTRYRGPMHSIENEVKRILGQHPATDLVDPDHDALNVQVRLNREALLFLATQLDRNIPDGLLPPEPAPPTVV